MLKFHWWQFAEAQRCKRRATLARVCHNQTIRCARRTIGLLLGILAAFAQGPAYAQTAAVLTIVSGDDQTGSVLSTLPRPLVVRVTSPLGGAVRGVRIDWRVVLGGGTVLAASTETDETGATSNGWTLGPEPGTNIVTATLPLGQIVGQSQAISVTFTAQAVPWIAEAVVATADPNAAEQGPDQGQFLILLNGPAGEQGMTVNYAVGGTATPGADYQALSGTASIPPGGTSATINVDPIDDAVAEDPETVTLTLQSGDGYIIGSTDSGTVTIADNDQGPVPPPPVEGEGTIEKVSGDNAMVVPGEPVTLVARVRDANGAPLGGVAVSWVASPAAAATLAQSTTVTGSDGLTSNTVTVGPPVDVQVTATAEGIGSVQFNVGAGLSSIPGLNDAQRSIAETIDIVCPSGKAGPDLQARCNELVVNADDAAGAVAGALQEIAPDEIASQATTALDTALAQFTNVASRLAALRRGARGLSLAGLNLNVDGQMVPTTLLASLLSGRETGGAASADDSGLGSRLGVFLNGSLSLGDKDETGREAGFDFDTQGITAGVDYRFTDQLVFGGAIGLAASDADFDEGGGMDTTGYSISAYGTYYRSDAFYLNGIASYGWTDYDTSRQIRYSIPTVDQSSLTLVDQKAKGDTDGSQYSFSLGGGYDFTRKGYTFGPYARIEYIRADIDGFREKVSDPSAPGAGWRLAVDDQEVESLTTALGGQVSYAMSRSWGVLVPQARAEWLHEFDDDNRLITGQFVEDAGGVKFGVPTDDPDRNYFTVGLGVSAVFPKGRSAFLFYETTLGLEDLTQHVLSGGVRLEF
jgi:uncharacterized protein with beta-barrel porin domain